ncbi:MAG: phospholipase D family protein [Bacteroidetes bacterium]|nr:phospholipase D family protein [Bacteroidota bacterium]
MKIITLYERNWKPFFQEELRKTKHLKIISPFIGAGILSEVGATCDYSKIELITRFSLKDFATGVSNLDALKEATVQGAKIFGVQGLHSKVYLFDDRAAIVTSANLTENGLSNNFECGIYTSDPSTIHDLLLYFRYLQSIAGMPLSVLRCAEWQSELDAKPPIVAQPPTDFHDYGANVSNIRTTTSYYLKFFGDARDRVDDTFTIEEEVDRALCHYACGFSRSKRPLQINEGDVIFLGRLTRKPHDVAIFGKAIAIEFNDDRDWATLRERQEREWKRKWEAYLRFRNPVFQKGTMADCYRLSDLMKDLDYRSFVTTSERFDAGERNIAVHMSFRQQPYVRLTHQAATVVERQLQQRIGKHGRISQQFIDGLPKSDIDPESWVSGRSPTVARSGEFLPTIY